MKGFCNTIEEFATPREIISLLAKFEVKYQGKVRQANDCERRVPERNAELSTLIPSSFVFKRKQSDRQRALALTNYLLKHIDDNDALKAFVAKVADIMASGRFTYEKPSLIAMPKSSDAQKKKATYRPLSSYSDLTTKVVLALEAEYLTVCFDSLFHDEMLAYRLPRTYHGQPHKVTANKDAVPTILEYLDAHRDSKIYVAECDIQKFFDILQHDVILECFDKMAEKARALHPGFSPSGARSLLVDFLDSYSFCNDIKKKGDDISFWKEALGKNYDPQWTYGFGWINENEARRLSSRDDLSDLGIPQGAALSTILTNIVLQSVDEAVISDQDPDRLFVRYCDDIVLMHTDYVECCKLKDAYAKSLTDHKLIYHDFCSINDCSKKAAGGNTKFYWDIKSKNPFLWGTASSNSAEWIGFLGYEIRRDGIVRMRRSSVGKKNVKMARDIRHIHSCTDPALRSRLLRRFSSLTISVPSGSRHEHNLLSSHSGITDNPWTRRQIKGLVRERRRYGRKNLTYSL